MTKQLSVAVLVIGTLATSPFLYFIIEYEQNNNYRTLINQLVSMIHFVLILLNISSQPLAFLIFAYGPLPEAVCYVDLVLRTSLTVIIILLLDAICAVRYIFIFHLKNPTATQHGFWTFFISCWVFAFSFSVHFVFALLPGNNPNFFYFCLGKFPASHSLQKTKINWSIIVIALFTILAHIFVGIKYLHFKYREKKGVIPSISAQHAVTCTLVNKSSLGSFTTNSCGIMLIIMVSTTAQKLNLIDKNKVDDLSEHIWAYLFFLYSPVLVQCASVLALLTRNANLLKHVKDKVKSTLDLLRGH